MEFSLTDDQEHIRHAAAEFLDAKFPPCAAQRREPADVRAQWQELVHKGWAGLALPKRYGGGGQGLLEACLLIEELGAHQVVVPLLPTVVCAAPAIDRFGTPEQCERWLPGIVDGRVITYARGGEWGLPGSGLLATEDENGFVLRGTAWFVPHVAVADELVVVARSGAVDDVTVFVIAADEIGIEHAELDVVGNEPQFRLDFNDVRVPRSRVLGEPGGGGRVVEFVDDRGTAATCIEMVGGGRQVLEMSVAYAKLREQFGRPIGAFQSVQHMCADMAVDVLGSRLIAYEAVCALDGGTGDALTVGSAKAWVTEAYHRVCARGHQVHGAIGYTEEHDLHFYLNHAVASSLSFGDADFHEERVSRALGL